MGGGTTKIGDPSFRADERPLLTNAQIDDNIAGIKRAFAQLCPPLAMGQAMPSW